MLLVPKSEGPVLHETDTVLKALHLVEIQEVRPHHKFAPEEELGSVLVLAITEVSVEHLLFNLWLNVSQHLFFFLVLGFNCIYYLGINLCLIHPFEYLQAIFVLLSDFPHSLLEAKYLKLGPVNFDSEHTKINIEVL